MRPTDLSAAQLAFEIRRRAALRGIAGTEAALRSLSYMPPSQDRDNVYALVELAGRLFAKMGGFYDAAPPGAS
jgi:hypothetical protein